ncbi:ROK family protein [Fusobacterium sp.]|uniref:ROK family protein n=1 Tax=Fusobacterium sp. TaxID=68766 RepID=UPI002637654A|nr:ROK family protein [Fusobacterium sp.]
MYQKKAHESNESNIFKYIFEGHKSFVINDIVENLDISFPTVKKIISSFLKKNIILENKKVSNGVGRKAMEYNFNDLFCYSIGILVSNKKIDFILTNACGKVLKKHSYLLESDEFQNEFLSFTNNFITSLGSEIKEKLIGIGISIPGIVNKEGNFIEFTSKYKADLSFIENLKSIFNVPILIENESNLAAVAEAFLTKNSIYNNFMVLTINDSIGISSFHQENLEKNFFFKAGRVHHMVIESNGKLCECGTHGCWGGYVSNKALINDFKKYFPEIKNYNEIFNDKYFESKVGKILLDDYLKYLSIGIKNLLFFSNPEKLIISGKICLYKQFLLQELVNKIYKNHIFYRGPETIEFSSFKENGSIIGAAMFPIFDKLL